MGLLQYLRAAAKSDAAVYTTFLQQFSRNNRALHIFHEGKEDPSFYGNFLERHVRRNQRIYYYQAKNKDSVYQNYNRINWTNFNKKRILFFVDKDFSDILKTQYPVDSNIFVTQYYSIENYLVDKSMFSRSIRELIGLEDDRANHYIAKEFHSGLQTFYKSSIILSAYILHHRKLNNPINLGNLLFNDFFDVSKDFKVRRKRGAINILDRKTGVQTSSSFTSLRSIIKDLLKIRNHKIFTRGKFELAYFVSCLNLVPEKLNENKAKGERKYKFSVNLSNSNAVAVIAPRLRQPSDLRSFLISNLK